MSHLSSSERRGVLVVAAISLLVVLGALFATQCNRLLSGLHESPKTTVISGHKQSDDISTCKDTVKNIFNKNISERQKTNRRTKGNNGHKKVQKKLKTYRQRHPRSEPIPQNTN